MMITTQPRSGPTSIFGRMPTSEQESRGSVVPGPVARLPKRRTAPLNRIRLEIHHGNRPFSGRGSTENSRRKHRSPLSNAVARRQPAGVGAHEELNNHG